MSEGRAPGAVDVAYFAQLSPGEILTEYDRPLTFLATPPAMLRADSTEWLISWRGGGPLSAKKNVPPSLAGRERWLAVRLSARRRAQILDEHISLREALGLPEMDEFLLSGPDPLAP